jgi:hypothetical protein
MLMNNDWRKLRVGDRLGFVNRPTVFTHPGYFVHRDTLRVCRRLIERRHPLRVVYLDDWKLPWIRCQFRRKDGRIDYHSLAINRDGWV